MKQNILDHFSGHWQDFYGKYLRSLKRLGGDEYLTRCPFHEDTNPSLNINSQTGQYFCHGCGKKGDGFHFYAKTSGLRTGPDFGKILHGIARDFGISGNGTGKKPRIVQTYDYTDAEGKLVFQVCRMVPKSFRQRRPNGKGGWTWNLKGVGYGLYRLPEVLKATEVIVVEGEKDANALADLGFTATTAPGGAKKWRDAYTEALKGKNIILIPDNDLPGREHMTRVGASLSGKVSSLKLLELPDLPSGGDVSDFLARFKDPDEAAERLSMMIDGAEPYQPPKTTSLEDIILSTGAFLALDLPGKRTLLHPWLKEDSINLLSGFRGSGKTWAALSILKAVCSEGSFGPWKTESPVPCLFLDGEMPASDVLARIKALNLSEGNKEPLYIYSDALANQHGIPRAHLGHDSWRISIKRLLALRHIKLFVIDNLASLASGLDENKKQDWDPINQWLLELRFAGIATIMLHHVNKDGGQRGTSAREDNLDVSVMLRTPSDYTPEDGARFIMHFTKHRIPTAELPLIADTEFKLVENEGEYIWTYENVKQQRKSEVLRLLDDGMEQKAISEVLNLSKGYVSKLKKRLIKDELLSKKGLLTIKGVEFLRGTR